MFQLKELIIVRKNKFISLVAAVLLTTTGAANAGLVGDTVGIRLTDGANDFGQKNVVVGAGEEGNFFGNQIFDFGDDDFSIRSTSNFCGISCGGQTVQLLLSSLDFGADLTGVTFTSNLNNVSVSFSNNSATFSWVDQSLNAGTYLSAQFITGNNVPEPSSLALAGLALAGLGVAARKRKASITA